MEFIQNYGTNQIFFDGTVYIIVPPMYTNQPVWSGFVSITAAISALEQYYGGSVLWGGGVIVVPTVSVPVLTEPVIQPIIQEPAITLQGDVSAAVNYFIAKYGAAMPKCEQWGYIHTGDRVVISVNATGGITWEYGGYGAVEDALRVLYPNVPCSSSPSVPSPGSGITMWSINTIKNIKGTVERTPSYLLWHITAPILKDVPYGGSDAIPVTYLDQKGNEQIGVYKKGAWGNGTLDYALDNGSYGMGDTYVKSSDVKILSQVAGKTMQIQYPAPKGLDTGTILLLLGAAALGLILFKGKK